MSCCCCCCQVTSVVSDSVWPQRQQPTSLPHPRDSPGKNTGVGCHFLLQCMKVKMKVKSLSRVQLFMTPWTAAHQAPPSMGFSKQEYWSGVPLPAPTQSLVYLKFWSVSDYLSVSSKFRMAMVDFPGKSTGVGCHCLLRQAS